MGRNIDASDSHKDKNCKKVITLREHCSERCRKKNCSVCIDFFRDSANAVPTTKNYTPEIPTLGVFARVSSTVVQWKSLALEEPPS